MAGIVATRYGDAAFQIAREQQALDRWQADLETVRSNFADRNLDNVLDDPNIDFNKKQEIIGDLFKGKVSPMVLNIVLLMIERGQIDGIKEMIDYFNTLVDKVNGVVRVEVTTAIPLDKEEEQRVGERIKTLSGAKEVRLTAKVDPSIIGGIITRVGDHLIDASVATRLTEMARAIA